MYKGLKGGRGRCTAEGTQWNFYYTSQKVLMSQPSKFDYDHQ